jgi:hypothetical protein
MAFKEFEINSGTGNDLNAGDTATNDYSGSGDWDGTSIFTPNDGSTPASFIAVNDWISIYSSSDTIAKAVARVTAVGAGVNGTVTVSTTDMMGTFIASTAGAHTARIKHGGYWASFLSCQLTFVLGTVKTLTQSVKIWVKAGTYANTTNRTVGVGGSQVFPIVFQGYKTTRGDMVGTPGFTAVAGTDIPTITFTTSAFTVTASDATFKNLDFTSAFTGATFSFSGARCRAEQVRSSNTSSNVGAIAFSMTGAGDEAVACYFSCPSTATKVINVATGGTVSIHASTISGGIAGITASTGLDVVRSLFTGQQGDTVSTNQTLHFINNSVYNQLGNGINFTAGNSGSVIANNYFSGGNVSGKAAFNNTSGANTSSIAFFGNAFFNWQNNYVGLAEPVQFMDVGTIAAEAFNNPGSGDFSIKSAYRGLAYPGPFENFSTTTSYLDFGAAEHQTPASSAVYHPLKAFIVRGA